MREWLATPAEFAYFFNLYRKSGKVRREVEDFKNMPGTPDEQEMWRHFTNWIDGQPGLAKAVLDYIAGRRLT